MTQEALKLCPFCGGEAYYDANLFIRIHCRDCRTTTKPIEDIKDAVTAWNTRAADTAKDALIQRYEDSMRFIIDTCIKPSDDFKGGAVQKIAQIQVLAKTALKPMPMTAAKAQGAAS